MIINLRAKSKLEFVLATYQKVDYAPKFDYASDGAIVLVDLEEHFDKVDGSRIYSAS